MSTLSQLMPFEEAIQALQARGVLPTNLSSAELRQLREGFHRQNFTSARTAIEGLLDLYKNGLGEILNPTTALNPETGLPRTTGLNPAELRLQVKQLIRDQGYQPNAGERGTIKDLSSDARINLMIRTNKEVMQGVGWFIQGNDPAALDAFPAQELVRVVDSRVKRNWTGRWQIAARNAGDTDALRILGATGRMMARKDSPLWAELGSSANFDDALDNPFPPFAFNSGMDVRDIGYQEAVALELIKPGEAVRPQLPDDLSQLFFNA